ncbi:mitochondrial cardiolipin hydrolase isoform X1 [Symphalangus syndactylus]|uniref:mitochondrial cardiolipin hydrolase isoform X1 n=1 Tax=Symphalangus syndactylus TaxID=9590 RepID=UPI00244146DB|nr:mitochondrial cardiolipin hydrolase isoform X1 [Symphalangus syndactylus]
MGLLRWQVAAAAAVGLALALEALPWVLRWLRSRRRRPRLEVLFFPSQVTCTEALLRAPGAALTGLPEGCPCGLPHGESALSRLLRALLAARASLELCLFAFSSPQLGRAVQLLHQRGVRVRVVTDCDYMALNGSQIGLLRKGSRSGMIKTWATCITSLPSWTRGCSSLAHSTGPRKPSRITGRMFSSRRTTSTCGFFWKNLSTSGKSLTLQSISFSHKKGKVTEAVPRLSPELEGDCFHGTELAAPPAKTKPNQQWG